MRVWLDDLRDPTDPEIKAKYGSDGTEVWVKTAGEAIDLLRSGSVVSISLDNDLGEGQPEGRTVADWIEMSAFHGTLPRMDVWVHSDNTVAASWMRRAVENAHKFWRRRP